MAQDIKIKQFRNLYKLSKEQINNLIYDYTTNHMSVPQLMIKYKLSKRIATKHLKNHGIKLRNNSECYRKTVDIIVKQKILQLYYEHYYTLSQISKELHISRHTVYSIIRDNGGCRSSNYSKIGIPRTQEVKNKISLKNKGQRVNLKKQIETKRKNNSFNLSKPEQELYNELVKKYGEENILKQYKEKRYPYYCDFYIKTEDMFIELNRHWTHGGKPYNPLDKECQNQLAVWLEKSKNSNFYKQAIYIWTDLDVRKLECAIKNNLNYKTIY